MVANTLVNPLLKLKNKTNNINKTVKSSTLTKADDLTNLNNELESTTDLPLIFKYYPTFVYKDLVNFLQFIKVEKQSSNNTLLSYRRGLILCLEILNQVLQDQSSPQSKVSSEIKSLKDLLSNRKTKKNAKLLDSYSRSSMNDDGTITDHQTLAKSQDLAHLDDNTPDQTNSIESTAQSDQQSSDQLAKNSLNSEPEVNYTYLTNFSWEQVNVKALKELLAQLHYQGKSISSRNLTLSILRTFFNWLVNNNRVSQNYPKLIKNLKTEVNIPVTVDNPTMHKLLDVINIDSFMDLRDQLIFMIMFTTGLRLSEVCNLNLQDINFNRKELNIIGKGNVNRIVPISSSVEKLLNLYLVIRERELIEKLSPTECDNLNIKVQSNLEVDLNQEEQVSTYAKYIVAQANRWNNTNSKTKTKSSSNQKGNKQQQTKFEKNGLMSLDSLLHKKAQLQNLNNTPSDSDNNLSNSITSSKQDIASEQPHNHKLKVNPLPTTHLLTKNGYELQLVEQTKSYLKNNAHPLHALFLSTRLKRISARAIQYRLDKRVSETNVGQKLSPHKLRHSFASQFLEQTENLRAVQEMLGHKNLITTQIYTHLDVKHLIEVYNRVHPQQIKYQQQLEQLQKQQNEQNEQNSLEPTETLEPSITDK